MRKLAVGITATLLLIQFQIEALAIPPLDLSQLAGGQGGGFAILSETGEFGAEAGFSVSEAGDVNGDGLSDLIVGAPDFVNSFGTPSGRSYVVFGKADLDAVNLSEVVVGVGGFVIDNFNSEAELGYSVSAAGDVNGDGLSDVVIGAYSQSSSGFFGSGRAYVIFGKSDGMPVNIPEDGDFENGGIAFIGEDFAGNAGFSVSAAGDVNGDGLADLLVGAPHGPLKNFSTDMSGRSYVILGRREPGSINLSEITAGLGGFAIDGELSGNQSGFSVSSAGDVNGDGFSDLVLGAPYADFNGFDSGRSYVVFGRRETSLITLSNIAAGTGGFPINGESQPGNSGFSVSSAGDVNGDGLADIIVGAPHASPSGSVAGRSYVIFDKTSTAGVSLTEVASGSGGFVINGETIYTDLERSGYSVSTAGDVNGDGLADLVVGDPNASPNGRLHSGRAYLVFGKTDTEAVNLSSIAAGTGGFAIDGEAAGDWAGHSVSTAGDVNGDGLADVLIGARNADGGKGRSYVVFSPSTPPTSPPPGIPPDAIYIARTLPGDGPGGRIVPPTILESARVKIDFSDEDEGSDQGEPSTELVAITNSPQGLMGLYPTSDIARSIWYIETIRTNYDSAELTFKYLNWEIYGISAPEAELAVYASDSLEGPWTQLNTVLDQNRNEARVTVSEFSYFAIGSTTLGSTPTPSPTPTQTPTPTPSPTFTPTPTLTPTPTPSPSPTLTPTPTPTSTPIPMPFLTHDYMQNGGTVFGWAGGPLQGFGGTASVGPSGLCMNAPGSGDNFVLWVSPERLIELAANTVYKTRLMVSSDQNATDAIPLFFFVYDNFNTGGGGNNFGGFSWLLDVDGGAQGIGRPHGRASFDFYMTPIAVAAAQWNAGAFTAQADLENDIRLQYRVIDANATLLTDADSGMVCVSRLEVTAVPRAELPTFTTVFDSPIASATHFAQALDETGTGGTAVIDDVTNTARYQLATMGDVRKTLGYFDATQADLNTQLYPVVWLGDSLYRTRVGVRAESSESDPIDVLFISNDTTNVELGASQYITRGAPGGAMDRVASPKLAAAEYEAYFFSQNATLSMTPNANRLRPLVIFFNTGNQAGEGTGGDATIVNTLEVDRFDSLP